jgi:S-adenosylmethionine:tRNA ribosyltransferase-isomerase
MMKLDVNKFLYTLPEDRIAQYPLIQRDQSKLLVYNKGTIRHEKFYDLVNFLPDDASLFFNETKVIPARLQFQKETGARIEIFLLHPVKPSALLIEVMQTSQSCSWKCTIGNLKRWPENVSLVKKTQSISLEASLKDRENGIVEFNWTGANSFAEILRLAGETPLPPYVKRKAEQTDKESYQTIYSNYEGAVAAPTAGLHFTPDVFESLAKKNIKRNFLTLHVSAGTFQPIKVKDAFEHTMHMEQIVVSRSTIENLLESKYVIAVGTTSLRTLESLYWYGVKLIKDAKAIFHISQQDPYFLDQQISKAASLQAILQFMDLNNKTSITGETSIYIVPGYTFKICQALITNFHQPGSTLMLLVAALIGEDWKTVYEEALSNEYRFLSYGDSSLLIPREKEDGV